MNMQLQMMLVGLTLMAIVLPCSADSFYLQDDSGGRHGPILLEDGAQVTLDGKTYTVRTETARETTRVAPVSVRHIPGARVAALLDDGLVLEDVPMLAKDQEGARQAVESGGSTLEFFLWKTEEGGDGRYYAKARTQIFIYADPAKYSVGATFDINTVYSCGYRFTEEAGRKNRLRAYAASKDQAVEHASGQ